jgi:hypothetical protein
MGVVGITTAATLVPNLAPISPTPAVKKTLYDLAAKQKFPVKGNQAITT